MTSSATHTAASKSAPAVLLTLGKYRFSFAALAVLITLFSTLLHTAALTYEKVIDDLQLIDSTVQRGCGDNPLECFQTPVFGLYYRPVLSASFSLAVRLHGVTAWPHHLTNLLLHAAAVGLAFWFFRLLFRRDLPALCAGALFALHPLQVPATTFIGGRTDTLALIGLMLFGIGAILAMRAEEDREQTGKREEGKGKSQREKKGTPVPILVSVFGFAFAVFSKEQVLPLILLLPLLAARNEGKGKRREKERGMRKEGKEGVQVLGIGSSGIGSSGLQENSEPNTQHSELRTQNPTPNTQHPILRTYFSFLFPVWWLLYLLPAALYLYMANKVIPRNTYEPANWSLALHIEMVGRTLWYYAKALFFPTIPTLHQSTLGHWDTPQLPLALLGFLCAGAWLAALRHLWTDRVLRFCWLWTTLTLLPCLNLLPLPSQAIAPYRAVIPMAGVVGLLGSLFAVWWERRGLVPASLFLLLCFLFSCISLADVPNWRNNVILVGKEVEVDPDFLPAQIGLAGVLQESQRYEEARRQYDRAKDILFPGATTPEARIARVHTPALYRFMRGHGALRYKPMDLLNVMMRGSGGTHQILGNYAEAVADYRVALAAKPDDYLVRDYLALAYMQQGRTLEAEATVKETLRLAPAPGRRIQLGEILLRAGRRQEAQETLLGIMMSSDWQRLTETEKNRVTGLYNEAGQPPR